SAFYVNVLVCTHLVVLKFMEDIFLVLALEKMKDESGSPKYSRTLVYQWLNNIRKVDYHNRLG
uniref:hypothetical protein n=1 Tax=Agathobacter sp. TaxID=2021311 RepID=UPI004057B498